MGTSESGEVLNPLWFRKSLGSSSRGGLAGTPSKPLLANTHEPATPEAGEESARAAPDSGAGAAVAVADAEQREQGRAEAEAWAADAVRGGEASAANNNEDELAPRYIRLMTGLRPTATASQREGALRAQCETAVHMMTVRHREEVKGLRRALESAERRAEEETARADRAESEFRSRAGASASTRFADDDDDDGSRRARGELAKWRARAVQAEAGLHASCVTHGAAERSAWRAYAVEVEAKMQIQKRLDERQARIALLEAKLKELGVQEVD
mmetsp:Transcript_4796/g.16522  ORF Transcript_4796/g.16522 Transcript_4796/m.16522 type:complete len:271 (-) Transcript_4796:20-832(-)